MISVYSVVSSILFYNLSLVILFVLRRNTDFMARYAISTLLFLSVLSIVRLVIPIDFESAYVIRSEVLVPKLINFLDYRCGNSRFSAGNILLLVWLAGTVIHSLGIVRQEYISRRQRSKYPQIKSEQLRAAAARLDITSSIVLSPLVNQPYTAGVFKPVIYLPYVEYTDTELYYILLHELQHIKSRDNFKRLIFLVMEAVFWWNPLAHIAVDEFELLTEYHCDAKIADGMDNDALLAYLRTIVSLLKHLNPDEDKVKPKLAVMFAQTYDIKQRFEVLLRRNHRKPKYIRCTMWLLMLAVFVMSYFVILQPYYSAPTEIVPVERGYEMDITKDNSFILLDGDKYILFHDGIPFEEIAKEELIHPPYDELIIIGE